MGQVERPLPNAAIIEADETWHGGNYRSACWSRLTR
jgi:hypothetical protein